MDAFEGFMAAIEARLGRPLDEAERDVLAARTTGADEAEGGRARLVQPDIAAWPPSGFAWPRALTQSVLSFG